jgi:pimeloyl-ACP methyl ester carboxylesterase
LNERPRPLYLQSAHGAVFGVLHLPDGPARRTSVLLCPPFGWDEVCTYRSRREWAIELARAGHPTLRIDLPGAGDGDGSPRDGGRVAAWVGATRAAGAWLRQQTAAERISAIGIGLGGLVAVAAALDEQAIDDLVVWAAPARGRKLARELRAFAGLQDEGLSPNRARRGLDERAQQPASADASGQLEVAGFLMTAETVVELAELDIEKLALDGHGRRATLLGRDGLEPDPRLRTHLQRSGWEVTCLPVQGYGAMMTEPQEAVPPRAVFAAVARWLADAPRAVAETVERQAPGARAVDSEVAIAQASSRLVLDGLCESPFTVPHAERELFGILAEPTGAESVGDICAVLLNAGAIHHIGPNRMWVELARRWATRGVPVARLDLSALGESDGDDDASRNPAARYAPETVDQVRAALDVLQERTGARRFVLVGLCSGAYWSFHTAIADERVACAMMLNPAALIWDPGLDKRRDLRTGLHDASLRRRALRGDISMARLRRIVRWSPNLLLLPLRRVRDALLARRRGGDQLDLALDALRERSTPTLMAFSQHEPLQEELEREGRLARLERWPNIELVSLPGTHHSLRAIESQRAAHAALDSMLEATFGIPPQSERPRSVAPGGGSGAAARQLHPRGKARAGGRLHDAVLDPGADGR